MRAKDIPLLIITAFMMLLLPGCDKKVPSSETSPKNPINAGIQADISDMDANGRLRLTLSAEPTYFNPLLSTDSASSTIEGLVFNGLLKVGESLEMLPDLAESYTVSPDGLVYTFLLRKGVKWHDGRPFTADDVVFTFEKLLDPSTNTVRRSNYIINGQNVRFKKTGTHQVTVTLPEPFAPFLIRMGMSIIPKHLFENEDINTSSLNQNPIGTGPFKFEKWESAQYVLLSRNEHYYDGPPRLKEIFLSIIPDANTALISLEKGEVDMGSVPFKEIKRIQSDSQLSLYQYQQLLYTYMGFNLMHPEFKNPLVRQAIAHAINKEAIIKGVLKGYGKVAHIPSSPVSWAYPGEGVIKSAQFDAEKAKSLLEKSGLKWNATSKLYERDGRPFEFTVITNQGNKDREKTAQIIQQYLQQIGIKMSIRLLEWSSFIKIVNEPTDPKGFDAVILGWSLGLDPDAKSIWHSSEYPSGFNFIGYKNKTADQLIEAGRREIDREKRRQIYGSLYQEIAADYPYIFLYYPDSTVAMNRRVGGLSKPGPLGLMHRIEEVFVTAEQ